MKLNSISLLTIGVISAATALAQPAETILTQGKIISANEKENIFQAMAIRDGKIGSGQVN